MKKFHCTAPLIIGANRYAAKCFRCGRRIEPGQGQVIAPSAAMDAVWHASGTGWHTGYPQRVLVTQHAECAAIWGGSTHHRIHGPCLAPPL
ncbi:hypothetical protein D2N39_11445 [Gemmobacter lutimaris]|uniref:Uncharacterized protein n=1 Tax=Gemmobacter lutimaris TaxID=2306023 RepID=A0A398BMX4_9RHOB|nr:hypothetical protein [Gemmobacter lutimaris]RID91845.1 hypothetical protein D2N39_11445 [Gemmobacter lutimaris]